MQLNILILPGDGIGTEVTCEAVKVLRKVASKFHHEPVLSEGLLGGIAIHKTGGPLPQETIDLALKADATLMGAVGLPEFDNVAPEKRPEKGLLGIRKALGVYANLRPVRSYKALLDSSPLKNSLVDGTDMIIVRELTGGHLLRDAARDFRNGQRRACGEHAGVYAGRDRACFAHGVSPGAESAQEGDQRR